MEIIYINIVFVMLHFVWYSSCSSIETSLHIIAKEYLKSNRKCHTLATENTVELSKDFVKVSLSSNTSFETHGLTKYQNLIQKSTDCFIILVDWETDSRNQMDRVMKASQRVIKSALLLFNCDKTCEDTIPKNLDKPLFYYGFASRGGEMVLRVSCPPMRAPKAVLFWKGSHAKLIESRACPFVFSGRSVNVSYISWPPSVIG